MIPDSAEVDAAVHITLTRSQQPCALEKGKGALLQPTALEVQVCLPFLLTCHSRCHDAVFPMLAQRQSLRTAHTVDLHCMMRHPASQHQGIAQQLAIRLCQCLGCGLYLLVCAGAGGPLAASAGLHGHPSIHPRPSIAGRPAQAGQGSRGPVALGECFAAAYCGTERSTMHGI